MTDINNIEFAYNQGKKMAIELYPYLSQVSVSNREPSEEAPRTSPTANNTPPPRLTTAEAQSVTFTSSVGFYYREWDDEADDFVLAANLAGDSAYEIATKLIMRGYAATRAEVIESLSLQRVPDPPLGPAPVVRFAWDQLADVFTLAGFVADKNVSEIHTGLLDQRYNVTEMEVRESLIRQGRWPIE